MSQPPVAALTLEQFAQSIGRDIVLHLRHSCAGTWMARLQNANVLLEAGRTVVYSTGATPEQAMQAYSRFIAGKTLSLDEGTTHRRMVEVPAALAEAA